MLRVFKWVLLLWWSAVCAVQAQPGVVAFADRPEVENRLLEERLEQLLPRLMREQGIDLWLVIAREYNDDPVFLSLVPKPRFTARRTTMLLFHDRGPEAGVERLTISRYPLGTLYQAAWEGGDLEAQWRRLAEVIAERDPEKIAVNVSATWPVADGLSHGLYRQLQEALGDGLSQRLVSAESLVVRWLETRTVAEVEVWQRAVAIARDTIAEAFSQRVITPGVTTLGEVAWFIRQRFETAGLAPWFHPDVNRQWQEADYGDTPFLGIGDPDMVIRRGDLLHTDVGLCYLGLCTDTQEMAYVLKLDETDAPPGLAAAMAVGNRWQDVLTGEFQTGRSGNEILAAAQRRLAAMDINHAIYSHPLGVYGHGPGPTIGMWDNQGPTPGRGDWPLYPMTGYAIEGSVSVAIPEWGGKPAQMKLEQSAVFDGEQVHYLAGRQTRLHLID
ncbi:MAG: M24 family metallopeptidase [Luminiphilus sp.]